MCCYNFVYSFNKYLLRIYCILDSDIGSRYVAINKRCYKIPVFMEFIVKTGEAGERQTVNKDNIYYTGL